MATKHPDIKRIELYARIGEQIAKRREELGLTVQDLADKMRTNDGTLHRIEQGDTPVPVHLLVSLAEFFDCTLDDLVPV